MDTFVGIIPARYASSRFPGKPLCDICGHPMIWHVYQSVIKWSKWEKVVVATDNHLIGNTCAEYKIPCIMTHESHVDCLEKLLTELAMVLINILLYKGMNHCLIYKH